jgi:hypothetical protein
MRRTVRETAILLAVLLKRSEQTRARVSEKTIRVVGRRSRLKAAFVVALRDELEEFGWSLVELPSGGFGAIQTSTLEAAKSVTALKYLTPEEAKGLRSGKMTTADFEAEAYPDDEEDAADDE